MSLALTTSAVGPLRDWQDTTYVISSPLLLCGKDRVMKQGGTVQDRSWQDVGHNKRWHSLPISSQAGFVANLLCTRQV